MNMSGLIFLLIWGLLIAVLFILLVPIRRSRQQANMPADRQSTPAIFRDDDRYWYGGLFYNNPDDPAVFVPKRFSFGWTVNVGHPRGKLFLIGMLLLPLVLLLVNILLFGTAPVGCHTFGCTP